MISKSLMTQLTIIRKNKLSLDKAAKLGINVNELRNNGLVTVKVLEHKDITIPKGVPKYAVKWKFTHKKYGIKVTVNEEKSVVITEKGLKLIKKSVIKPEEEPKKSSKIKPKETETIDEI